MGCMRRVATRARAGLAHVHVMLGLLTTQVHVYV